jgi:hypothetical protein
MKFSQLAVVVTLVSLSSAAFSQSTPTKPVTVNEGNPVIRTQDNYNIPQTTPRIINTMAVPQIGYVSGAVSDVKGVSVADLNTVTAGVRQVLAKNGYSVLETKAMDKKVVDPATPEARVQEAVSNMSGNFANAAYVLVGTVTKVSAVNSDNYVYGDDQKLINKGYTSTVKFDVIDFDTKKVVSSFDARGTGMDAATAKGFNRVQVLKSATDSLANDVVKNLKSLGINPNNKDLKVLGKDAPAPKTFVEPLKK